MKKFEGKKELLRGLSNTLILVLVKGSPIIKINFSIESIKHHKPQIRAKTFFAEYWIALRIKGVVLHSLSLTNLKPAHMKNNK